MARTYSIELELRRDLGATFLSQEMIAYTERFIDLHEERLPADYRLSFWFQLSGIHFTLGDLGRSLHWVNRILNSRFREGRDDLRVQARLLNLILHMEKQNFMVLRYYVDSTRRYMKKVRGIQTHEKMLLAFFIKAGRLPLSDLPEVFRELRDKLFPVDGEPLVPETFFGFIDFRAWIEGKLK
jgi:hypothetical protein